MKKLRSKVTNQAYIHSRPEIEAPAAHNIAQCDQARRLASRTAHQLGRLGRLRTI
jgi:hypothetical protein